MNTYTTYQTLMRPSFAPPSEVFGPVWSFLYILIAISFGQVFVMAFRKKISWVVALPFILNLIFNFAYTPLMFGLKNLPLATLDILLVLSTLVWAMIAIYPHKKWVMYMQIPYLLWVSFATVLQLSIVWLN